MPRASTAEVAGVDEVALQRRCQRLGVGDHALALEVGHSHGDLLHAPVELAFKALRLLVSHLDVAHEAAFAAAPRIQPFNSPLSCQATGTTYPSRNARSRGLGRDRVRGSPQAPEKTEQP
jgi:hypothetical protein